MKVLITGGSGFIGSHLADSLIAHGNEVYVIDDFSTGRAENTAHLSSNPRFRCIHDSILDRAVMNDLVRRVDHIYHLAAVVGVRLVVESPVRTLEANLKGTEIVLDLAHKFNKKVFIASTSEVYGRHASNRPLSETDERIYGPTTVGRWSYAGAKAIDEFLGLAYHKERGLDVVIGRFFNTVGPRQTGQYGMVVPRFIQAALSGEPILVYGDGTQTRSFTYVGDAVWAITQLMRTPEAVGEVFNIGNGQEVSINELAHFIKEYTRSTSPIRKVSYETIYGQGFEDMEFRTPNIAKLSQYTGYHPTVNLDGIIERVVAFFRQKTHGDEHTDPVAVASSPSLSTADGMN